MPKTCNSRFQASEPLFDFAHVVLDAADISADRPQVFENRIFNVIGHGGSLVGHHPKVYHEVVGGRSGMVRRFRQRRMIDEGGRRPPYPAMRATGSFSKGRRVQQFRIARPIERIHPIFYEAVKA